MRAIKFSEFPKPFVGQKLLLEAQRRGAEICGSIGVNDASALMLIGLANIFVEYGVLPDCERRKFPQVMLPKNEERRNDSRPAFGLPRTEVTSQ